MARSKKSRTYIYINRKQRSLNVCLSLKEYEEDGDWLAECPELQIIAPGKTKLSAYNTLVELILTTLIVAIETDLIDEHLKALGFGEIELPVPSLEIYSSKKRIAHDTIPLSLDSPITLPTLTKHAVEAFC